jgi:hypothetical protein
MNDELISLVDCQPANLVWVSGWYDAAHTRPTGWHLYQFGISGPFWWGSDFPSVMPVCRAPSFDRQNHERWINIEKWVDPRTGGNFWCHACIVEIVMTFPHIFTGGRR